MIILLKIKAHEFEVEVQAVWQESKITYQARLVTGFISYFDAHTTITGHSVDAALSNMATQLESALEQLYT